MATARQAIPIIVMEDTGTDVSEDLRPSLLEFRVVDALHGEADRLRLTLEDRAGRWRGAWRPEAGTRIRARTRLENWTEDGQTITVDWGSFEIDQIRLAGPPSQVEIGALSAYVSRSMRLLNRTQAWEGTSLQSIAEEIANRHDLGFAYATGRNPSFDRIDQTDTPDLRFLAQQCARWNIHCKVRGGRLLLTDDTELTPLDRPIVRAAEPEVVDGTLSTRFDLEERRYQLAAACTCVYDDPVRGAGGDAIKRTVKDAAAPDTAETLTVNERVGDPAQAELRAGAELERTNREEKAGRVPTVGRPDLRAGFTAPLEGFGRFDGRYVIDRATHRIGGQGYVTECDVRLLRDLLI